MPVLTETKLTAFPSHLLRDRVAIVTGGSRGIGRATVQRLAEAGAHVVVNYLSHTKEANEAVREVAGLGGRSLAIQADVSNSSEAAALIEQTLDQFGRLDLLVANAGDLGGAPVEEMTDDVGPRADCNCAEAWTVTRAAVPALKNNGGGSIVIVSSTAGQRGEAGYSNYAASKGGQISFAKSLATELAPKIRVNVVAPGWVDTELNHVVFTAEENEEKRRAIEAIPLKRLATADDVANAIVFLGSDWARHLTGEVLNINGGAVLCG